MALETGSFISDLVTSNPPGTDAKSQGDDHFRLIKTVLQGSFPNSDRAYRIPVALAAKVAAYTVLATDENSLIQADVSGGAFTVTLPAVAAVDDGWTVTVMKSDVSANAVTVDGNGAETINGAASRSLSSQYEAETYMRDGSEWKVISLNTLTLGATNTAIEALSPVADEMIYFTGADVAAVATITAFARTILDDAAQANVQATLALVPGTDIQAFDAVLEDLAALSVVANNEFIVGNGAGTYAHEGGATARTSMGAAASGALDAPSGTTMLFHQTAAPTGWTKDVAATLDNSALRVVTSTAWASGKQGATAFDSVFGSGKTSGNYTLAEADIPSHTHTVPKGTSLVDNARFEPATSGAATSPSGATGGGGAHQHTLSLDLNYINMIIASKD